MNLLRKLKAFTFAVSIIYIVIGLIMLLNPKFVCDAVNYIIGSLVLLYGVIYLINVYQKDHEVLNKFDFLAGIMCLSFGLFLILNTNVLLSLIPFCGGVVILVDALCQIRNSISLKRLNSRYWWINLVIGLVFISFSIFIIVRASFVTYFIIRLIGCILIIDGIMDFYTYFVMRKFHKKLEVIDSKTLEIE